MIRYLCKLSLTALQIEIQTRWGAGVVLYVEFARVLVYNRIRARTVRLSISVYEVLYVTVTEEEKNAI